MRPATRFMLDNSDVITFHSYDDSATVEKLITALERYGRPIICSEYMARPRGSTFQSILPIFARRHIGAINWGFVSGKTQTIYPWDSWNNEYKAEPKVWFHDIFRGNGAPYDSMEVWIIRALTNRAPRGIREAVHHARLDPIDSRYPAVPFLRDLPLRNPQVDP
jgi:hypothetical protein